LLYMPGNPLIVCTKKITIRIYDKAILIIYEYDLMVYVTRGCWIGPLPLCMRRNVEKGQE